jgi:transcription initiation factor TFIIIB Brf1 subunit/transcription initiation factor TFIIB
LTTILRRISCEVTVSAARAVWTNPENADDVASDALQILAKASRANLRFFNGRTPKCLLGGLFYLLGYRYGVTVTQREIADLLCTTEVSVRISYLSWLEAFPQFFTDIAVKMPCRRRIKPQPNYSLELCRCEIIESNLSTK